MNKRYECVLDTSFLAELLTQYDFAYPLMELSERGIFTQKVTKILNTIIKNPDIGGRIVASSTAFVELLNKF